MSNSERMLVAAGLLFFAIIIIGIMHEEHTREQKGLPGGWAEIDSLYVWARDKR